MAKANIPLLAWNRGIIDPRALARVDLDRTRLSAEVMTNWLPKSQGEMTIRPGTKYSGSSLNDTGAYWIEFVAATDDTALIELTGGKMRVWVPSDTGKNWETPVQDSVPVPLARPAVGTTVSLSDTGWEDASTGGVVLISQADLIPAMTGATTSGVTISASTENASGGFQAWKAADNTINTVWSDTGTNGGTLPSWWNVDFGAGNAQTVRSYTVRSGDLSNYLDNAPKTWRLIGSNYDTGTFATDTGKWALEDERTTETGWALSEQRLYDLTDTGTADAWRHWRLYVTAVDGDTELVISEVEMFAEPSATQVTFSSGVLTLNATAKGSLAKVAKHIVVDTGDRDVEHSFVVHVSQGPITFRAGSSSGNDDYISETSLGTGYHNLAFTPDTDVYVTIQSDEDINRVVQSFDIGDTGTVELTAPWSANAVDYIRYDQSADVVYVDNEFVDPHKIERRGTGRSFSVVEYRPNNGPFLAGATSSARLNVAARSGNTTLTSDIPFFKSGHVDALFRLTHDGQSGRFYLGAKEATTDVIEMTGISDTGTTPGATNERRIVFSVDTGLPYKGTIVLERSFDGPDFGFKEVTSNFITSGSGSDTGSFTTTIDDDDDNVTIWYRARMSEWDSGAAEVNVTYKNGSVTGIGRVTAFNSNTSVDFEILKRFSDTGSTDVWEEGAWSGVRGYPGSVAFHEGRLAHAGKANVWLTVSDDFENFDSDVVGDAGPISKTLGSGPVDSVFYLISLLRLVAGTAGAEIAIKSSSLDEPLTPSNSSAKPFSTQGSANIQARKVDNKGIFVQRSGQRAYSVGFGQDYASVSDYESRDLTALAPRILKPGVKSIAVQRQPDTRIHFVLNDGTVAILTFEPQEEILAWSMWKTDTGTDSAVERAMVLPDENEDNVYYHVRRTIGGATKRYLEKWARETECLGDTGLSWLADCAISSTDTGASLTRVGFDHLAGQTVTGWANDTGQSNSVGRDLTPDDTGGDQQLLAIDTGGDLTLTDSGVKHVVAGLPYEPLYKGAKLAYGAQGGTALAQRKRVPQMGLVLYQAHNNGLYFGGDTGHLDPLPRILDEGAEVDADKIFEALDTEAITFDDYHGTDSRIILKGRAPRPMTVLAAVPTVDTNEDL